MMDYTREKCETECRKIFAKQSLYTGSTDSTVDCCQFSVVDSKNECTMGEGTKMFYTGGHIAMVNIMEGIKFK